MSLSKLDFWQFPSDITPDEIVVFWQIWYQWICLVTTLQNVCSFMCAVNNARVRLYTCYQKSEPWKVKKVQKCWKVTTRQIHSYQICQDTALQSKVIAIWKLKFYCNFFGVVGIKQQRQFQCILGKIVCLYLRHCHAWQLQWQSDRHRDTPVLLDVFKWTLFFCDDNAKNVTKGLHFLKDHNFLLNCRT